MKNAFISKTLFAPPYYSHSVTVSSTEYLFTAGAVPLDKKGRIIGSGNIQKQTKTVVQNLKAVLRENGFTIKHIVKITVYVVAINQKPLKTAWEELGTLGITGPHIAASLIGVSCLGYPDQLIEIELIAAK